MALADALLGGVGQLTDVGGVDASLDAPESGVTEGPVAPASRSEGGVEPASGVVSKSLPEPETFVGEPELPPAALSANPSPDSLPPLPADPVSPVPEVLKPLFVPFPFPEQPS